ncbi:MAG: DUF3667 domain-containing protein [Bacteroidaceae bacterium]|nr:DUF3667 domain-containing protein [Bacteroidaceae bacterium]
MNEKWRVGYRRLRAWQRRGTHLPALKLEDAEPHVCLCCGTEFRGHFCPGCGQKSDTKRLTVRHVVDSVLSIFTNADGRLIHTLRDLFSRPGYMMRDYVRGHRVEYISPIQMLFCLATVYLFIQWVLHVNPDEAIITQAVPTNTAETAVEMALTQQVQSFLRTFMSNKAFSSLAMVFFMTVPMKYRLRHTERGRDLNYVELYYIAAYAECQSMIIVIAMLPLMWLTGRVCAEAMMLVDAMFYVWDFRQLLDVSWWRSFRIAISTYLLVILEVFILFLVGVVVAMIIGIKNGTLQLG